LTSRAGFKGQGDEARKGGRPWWRRLSPSSCIVRLPASSRSTRSRFGTRG